jgi:hypothetical protein
MKRRIVLILWMISLVLLSPPVVAQDSSDDGNCSPEAVKTWLVERQKWRNATHDVVNSDTMLVRDARLYLFQHLEAIEALDRPTCADSVMLWTYYL